MKKIVFGAMSALVFGFLASACSTAPQEKVIVTETAEPVVAQQFGGMQPEAPPAAEEGGDETSCNTNKDCALIPTEGCFGCMGSDGHRAVNVQTAKAVMGAKKDQCMQAMRNFRPQQGGQKDESCQFNGANCENGQCVMVKLSKEEAQARMPQRPQGGQQGGQQQGGFGGQQGGFGGQQGGFGGQQGGFGGQQGGFGGQQGGFGGQQGGFDGGF